MTTTVPPESLQEVVVRKIDPTLGKFLDSEPTQGRISLALRAGMHFLLHPLGEGLLRDMGKVEKVQRGNEGSLTVNIEGGSTYSIFMINPPEVEEFLSESRQTTRVILESLKQRSKQKVQK